MPTIIDLGAFLIRLFAGEHGLPHVHVVGADFAAVVTIQSCDILIGNIPPAHRKLALSWIADHQSELITAWNDMNPQRSAP